MSETNSEANRSSPLWQECCDTLEHTRGIKVTPVELIALALTDIESDPVRYFHRAREIEKDLMHATAEERRSLRRLEESIHGAQDLPVGARYTLRAVQNQLCSPSV
jgi:hypothetical protein